MVFIGIQPRQIVYRAKLIDPKLWDGEKWPHVFKPIELREVLETEYPTDAHFVPYFVEGEEEYPACAKNMLGLIRQAGGEIKTQLLVLDLDTSPHREWSPDKLKQFGDDMERILADPDIPQPTHLYTTKNGARLLFELTSPIPVDIAEPKTRGLMEIYRSALRGSTVDVDSSGMNWDRCYRLPRVNRDGAQSWKLASFHILSFSEHILDPADISEVGPRSTAAGETPEELDLPMPTPEEAQECLECQGAQGKRKATEWYKTAKHYLKGRDPYKACFEGAPAPPAGERDQTIQQYVGCVVAMTHACAGASPEGCYALLLDWVLQIHPDECKIPPDRALWTAVLKYWAKEGAKIEAQEKAQEKAQVQTVEKIDQIVAGMQVWCKAPELREGQDKARAWVLRHLIAFNGHTSKAYVMLPTGYYDAVGCSLANLRAYLIDIGMDDIIALERMTDDRVVEVRPQELVETYGVLFDREMAMMNVAGTQITNLDGEGKKDLIWPICNINKDLEPTYHAEVDAWLHCMFDDHYQDVENWVANALCLDEGMPICALSMCGPPSVGKKLFVQGLAECVDTHPHSLAGAEVFGKYTSSLRSATFVNIDEGLPDDRFSTHGSIADIFRKLVSGDPIQLEEKYRAPIILKCPLRLIFTSNNVDMVERLAGGEGLSTEDLAALSMRLMHVPTHSKAATYLSGLGGRSYTGRPGNEWIANDGDFAKTQYIVAKHFLWIHANKLYKNLRGNRMLVEGDPNDSTLSDMQVGSNLGEAIVATLLAITNSHNKMSFVGYTEYDGNIYVTTHLVQDMCQKIRQKQTPQRLIGKHLRRFTKGVCSTQKSIPLLDGSMSSRVRWWTIDLPKLIKQAEMSGAPHDYIRKFVKKG